MATGSGAIKRLVWIGAVGLAALAGWAIWLSQSVLRVEPGQQAVVGGVAVLEPGLHLVNAFGPDAVVYDTLLERQYALSEPVMVEGCAVTLLFTFNVRDVVAFHGAGGDFDALAAAEAEIVDLAQAAGLTVEGLRGPAIVALRDAVQEIAPPGIGIVRLNADVGACDGPAPVPVPQEPVEIERVEVGLLAADAPLGAERVELDSLHLLTRDNARLELSGAVASFDVFDESRARSCFGEFEGMAGLQVGRIVEAGLREAAFTHDRVDVPGAIAALVPSQAAQMETNCGLRIGPLDVSEARLEWIRAAR